MKIFEHTHNGTTYSVALYAGTKRLIVQGNITGFEGDTIAENERHCPLTPINAAQLRHRLDWLHPCPLGLATSAGFGDRLGIATPGHVQAVRGTGIAPIFAQQSVRENMRTKRNPQQVMDDAMWGVFESGWCKTWGADADHLKTTTDIDQFIAAGYTFFTIDPGEYVDDTTEADDLPTLRQKVEILDWQTLESSPNELRANYLKSFPELNLTFDEPILLKAAAKYGRAISHTVKMSRYLMTNLTNFDLEMSVDETNTTTSLAEHFYIMSELKRLSIPIVSLAPRFVGRFEKGVDYIGDLAELEANMAGHAAIQRYFGHTYKLSLHSGSDKFSVYPIAMRNTNGLVHLKTAGTSYLEALRVLAEQDSDFFREILTFACSCYTIDRQTYHVSAKLENFPSNLSDDQLPTLLNHFDARQILHVTFGSVLDHFGEEFHRKISEYTTEYHATLKRHFDKHLAPFSTAYQPPSGQLTLS